MSIFKLKPACKDYLWGGHRLVEDYGIEYDGQVCAEAWSLSCHRDGESLIENGENAGKKLSEVIEGDRDMILGTNAARYKDFPVLIKLIDAKKPLSIQVHPDDEYALLHENQYGKTEMWYILDADEGAFLYQGFDHEISKEEFSERIKSNTLEEVLNKVYVNKGDCIFIPPGTLHAIGAGILIAEIQQSSNVTYRIYDYGRLGADGKPRDLHIEKSLDVTKLERPTEYSGSDQHLVSCRYFCTDLLVVKENAAIADASDGSSFVSLLVIDGECRVRSDGDDITAQKGDSLFITADEGSFEITGNAEIIKTTIPQ